MKKIATSCILILTMVVMFSVPVFAQDYSTDFPEYVPIAGGAWCQVDTPQGEITILVPADYIFDTFSFSGDGYNIANATNATVTGMAYAKSNFSYYGSPRQLQCRFQSMGTLQVYEPYENNYGNTSYRWTDLDIEEIKATSINFTDARGDRQNDNYRYSVAEKIGICIFVAVMILVLMKLFKKGWKA